jgi:hypothetical protein
VVAVESIAGAILEIFLAFMAAECRGNENCSTAGFDAIAAVERTGAPWCPFADLAVDGASVLVARLGLFLLGATLAAVGRLLGD